MDDTKLTKHSITLKGHQTSFTLEVIFWQALKQIAAHEKVSVKSLVESIDATRTGNLSSAIRVYVLKHRHPISENKVSSRGTEETAP